MTCSHDHAIAKRKQHHRAVAPWWRGVGGPLWLSSLLLCIAILGFPGIGLPAVAEEDTGAMVYVGPPIPEPTDGSMALIVDRSVARAAGGDLYPAAVGSVISFPRDADGFCADTELQLISSDLSHDGRLRGQLSADIDEDGVTGNCTVNVITNKLIKHLEYDPPAVPRGGQSSYAGEHQYRMKVRADLKKKLSDNIYSPYVRAKVYVGMKWWDHWAFPGGAVYGGFDQYYRYYTKPHSGWYFGGPEAFQEVFITDGLEGYVGALASGAYLRISPPLLTASATALFVAVPYGRTQVRCKKHNGVVHGKIRYRWFCDFDKRLDIVQF